MAARLKEKYSSEIKSAIQKELGLENVMAVPRIEKIVINMGLGEATQNVKIMDPLMADLGAIAGQKPVVTKAKKSIAAFKLREGMPIGAMVTLRGDTMYEFLDRLISVALPRVRDFRGVSSKSFDGRGNYTLGLARPAHLSGDRLLQGRQDQGYERHHRHHCSGRQRRPHIAQGVRHALPPGRVREKDTDYGNHCKARQRRKEAEVQVPPAQPLPALRSSARVPPQVRRLPSLLPFSGAQGRNPGRREVVAGKQPAQVFCPAGSLARQAEAQGRKP